MDLRLTRIVKKAELVCVGNQAAGADMLRKGEIHAYAAPGPALMEISDQLAGTHVLDDSFSSIEFAGFIPNGHDRLVSYVSDFLEEAKASHMIEALIARNNLRGMKAAPPLK